VNISVLHRTLELGGPYHMVGPTRPRTQHGYHHDTTVKPESEPLQSLSSWWWARKTPETRWAVNRRQDNKPKKLLHLVGDLFEFVKPPQKTSLVKNFSTDKRQKHRGTVNESLLHHFRFIIKAWMTCTCNVLYTENIHYKNNTHAHAQAHTHTNILCIIYRTVNKCFVHVCISEVTVMTRHYLG